MIPVHYAAPFQRSKTLPHRKISKKNDIPHHIYALIMHFSRRKTRLTFTLLPVQGNSTRQRLTYQIDTEPFQVRKRPVSEPTCAVYRLSQNAGILFIIGVSFHIHISAPPCLHKVYKTEALKPSCHPYSFLPTMSASGNRAIQEERFCYYHAVQVHNNDFCIPHNHCLHTHKPHATGYMNQ